MAICVLVRHGQSTSNLEGTLAGWTEGIALTPKGQEQARHAGEVLRPLTVAAVISSPVQRCQETAAGLSLGREVTLDEGLGECHYGAWTGRALSELAGEPLWRTVQDDPAQAQFPPSPTYAAESLAQMADRLCTTIARHDAQVSAEHGEDAVWVAVSHGDPIKAVLAYASGADVSSLQRHHVDPGSMSVIRYQEQRSLILATNLKDGDVQALIASTRSIKAGNVPVGGGAG